MDEWCQRAARRLLTRSRSSSRRRREAKPPLQHHRRSRRCHCRSVAALAPPVLQAQPDRKRGRRLCRDLRPTQPHRVASSPGLVTTGAHTASQRRAPCHVTRRASFSLTAHLPPSRHTPLHSLSAPHAPPSLPPPRLRALSLRSKRMSAERVSMVPEDADHAKNWALRKLQDAVRALIFRKVRLPRPLRPPLRCPRRTPISRLAPPPHPGHSPCRPPRPAPPPPALVLPCSPPPSSLHHHR